MTVDVDKFCLSLTELISNVLKPTLDILIYARRLQTSVGPLIPLSMAAYLFSSGAVLTRTRRPAGDYTVGRWLRRKSTSVHTDSPTPRTHLYNNRPPFRRRKETIVLSPTV